MPTRPSTRQTIRRPVVGQLAPFAAGLLLALLPARSPGAGDLVWTQSDWSRGGYEMAQGIDADIHPGLLVLLNHPEDMRFVAEPTAFQGIYALAVYHDTLFLGASPYPLVADGAEVLAYDYATDAFSLDYEPFEQGIVALKVYGDTLYLPGPDSRGGWNWGNIYLRDPEGWIRKETVPSGVHVFDLTILNGSIFVTGGYRDSSGKVWRSDDQGDTFYDSYVIPYNGGIAGVRRLYACETYRDKVYAQPDGRGGDLFLVRFDGAVWDSLPIPNMPLNRQGLFTAWGDSLIFTISNRMYFIVGDQVTQRYLPFQGNTWCRSVHRYGNALYGGALSGLLYRWRPETHWVLMGQLGLDPATEEIEGLAEYFGRLYVSTSRPDGYAGGRLYVSAAEPSGELVSRAHDFGRPTGDGLLSWDGFSPLPEGRVRLQLRSSHSPLLLPQQPFVGPDGTDRTYYESSPAALPPGHQGDRHFQYRVEMLCPDGLRMPWLRSVTLAVDSLDASAVAELEARRGPELLPRGAARWILDPPSPNPAGGAVAFAARFLAGAGASAPSPGAAGGAALRVFDPGGREIRSAFVPAASGAARWQWDLRDAGGREVPAGTYWVSVRWTGDGDPIESGRAFVVVR
ncbi:MAG: hypothetical protein FJY75_11865 [Candidatus Eisenbacteria bacterium]|uniref:FlgD Ig-like domain-containing protein n=1 Tax=Eiseniibacteriota bacterium TaxID=2212470 RepID=A0A937XDZ1_UNCEI|nr:hypothetical protein [Candidatus Eisenbacteria bacterium]